MAQSRSGWYLGHWAASAASVAALGAVGGEQRREVRRDRDRVGRRVEDGRGEDDRVRVAGDQRLPQRRPDAEPVAADVRVALGGRRPPEADRDGAGGLGDVEPLDRVLGLERPALVHRRAEPEQDGRIDAEAAGRRGQIGQPALHDVVAEQRGAGRRVAGEVDLAGGVAHVVREREAVEVAVAGAAGHTEVRLRRARRVDARLARPARDRQRRYAAG